MARIILHTRGDASFGMGHLYRTSWLLEVLEAQQRRDLEISVRCVDSPAARSFWQSRSVRAEYIAEATLDSAPLQTGDVCVVDWLDTPPAEVQAARSAGARLLLLEDNGPGRPDADVVVNSLTAPLENRIYHEGRAWIHEGAAWLQFSPALTRLRGVVQATTRAMEAELKAPPDQLATETANYVFLVLLSFGGSPRAELVQGALQSLQQAHYDQQVIVMPAGPEGGQDLQPHDAAYSVQALPAGGAFYDYLASADLLICAGGLTLYEAAFLGVPSVCLPLNDHQYLSALKLEVAGCCIAGGQPLQTDWDLLGRRLARLLHQPRERGSMSGAGRALTDGRGLLRTAELALKLAAGPFKPE